MRRAESASWWLPALFWIDERSPGMAGNLTWGRLHARILLKVVLGRLVLAAILRAAFGRGICEAMSSEQGVVDAFEEVLQGDR